MTIQQLITQYPIGAQIVLKDDDSNDEPHEVVGYKKINGNYYLLFKNGGMVVAER